MCGRIVEVLTLTQIQTNHNLVVLTRVFLPFRGQMAIFEDNFGCHDLAGVVVLLAVVLRASSWLRPVMLWDIL